MLGCQRIVDLIHNIIWLISPTTQCNNRYLILLSGMNLAVELYSLLTVGQFTWQHILGYMTADWSK